MTRSLVACTLLWLTAMLALAAPRNVGDASEYVGMALNLSRLRPPALSDAELRAFTQRFVDTPARFELESRRIPELLGRDGRYDMPHMWVYPLLAVPGVWVARLLGLSPAWGFVGLNTALLAGLLALAFRRGAGPWTLVLAASPFVWWLDKPLADPLIACALGAALLLWPTYGPVSLVLLGVATAQNPALAVACVIFAACAVVQSPARLRDRRWWTGALAGAGCAAIGPAYAFWRLGRLSPLTSYVEAWWPTLTSLLFPLTDLNMGALVRFPIGALVVALALCRRTAWSSPAAPPAALTAVALLLVFSQQPNMNQGGNPDLSRYAVWLLPLALPWLLAADRSPRPIMRGGGVLLLGASAVWTAVAFPPTRPESYRYPTTMARWIWTRHPSWSVPRPEAFAERTSHREPAIVPTATPGCEKVLLYEGSWPASCPPAHAEMPATCGQAGTYCYADDYGPGRHTVRYVGTLPSWLPVVHDRTWRAGDGNATWVAGLIDGLQAGDPAEPRLSIRAVSHVGWTQTWWGAEGRFVVYARHAGEGARLALRHAGPATLTVRTPDRIENTKRIDPAEAPTIVALPAGPHVVVEVRVE